MSEKDEARSKPRKLKDYQTPPGALDPALRALHDADQAKPIAKTPKRPWLTWLGIGTVVGLGVCYLMGWWP